MRALARKVFDLFYKINIEIFSNSDIDRSMHVNELSQFAFPEQHL